MKTKRLVQRILVPVVLSLGFSWSAWAHEVCPDRHNVTQQGKVITVKPTGISDTKNLQCALDLAVAAGRASVVQLGRGKFYTAQLAAINFKGMIRGEGMKHTILQNLPNLCVTPDNYPLAPPTPPPSPTPSANDPCPAGKNPWAALLVFYNGDAAVRDLAIQIVGAEPTRGFTLTAFGLPKDLILKALSSAIAAGGTHVDLRVSRVSVSGEPAPNDPFFGFNLYNGILSQGGSPALAGLYEVRGSRFSTMAAATGVATMKDAGVVVENNTYEEVLWAGQFGGVTNTNVRFVNNNASANLYGIEVADFDPQTPGFTDSRLFIAHNTFKGGGTAVGINAAFSGKNSCLVVLNDTTRVTKLPAIVLGPRTKDCLAITHEAGTVADSGTGNRVITVPRR